MPGFFPKTLFLLALTSSLAAAAEKMELIGCVNSLDSSISNLWKTPDSTLHCEPKSKKCYVIGVKEDFSFGIPSKSSKTEEAVDIDIAERKMKIIHYYVQFKNTGSAERHFLDISQTPQGTFARILAPEKRSEAEKVTLSPTTGRDFESTLLIQVQGNLRLIEKNIVENSFPPGWNKARYIAECKHRLSGCHSLAKQETLRELFTNVEACKP